MLLYYKINNNGGNILEELVIKPINKDDKAFEDIITLVKNDLYRIAQARLENIEDINDAIQETLIIAYKSIKKLNKPQYFKTWIIKILINECNKIYNLNNKKLNLLKKITKNKYFEKFTDEEIFSLEKKMEVEEVLKTINYEERICLVLFYNSKYSIQEIAEILNSNPETIRSRIKRGKNKIREYNQKRGKIENAI